MFDVVESIAHFGKTAETAGFWLFLGFLLLLFVGCAWQTMVSIGQLRSIGGAVKHESARAGGGYGKVLGHAAATPAGGQSQDGELVAPFSGASCVFYRVEIARKSGGENNEWRSIFKDRSTLPLLVDDGSSSVYAVDIAAADEVMNPKRHVWFNYETDLPAPLQGQDPGWFSNSIRFTEERIDAGERVYALGDLEIRPMEKAARVDAAARRILEAWRSWSADYGLGRDGRPAAEHNPNHVDAMADPEARKEATVCWVRERCGGTSVPILSEVSNGRRPFLVGIGEEKTVTRTVRWRIALAFPLGVVSAFVVVTMAAGRFISL